MEITLIVECTAAVFSLLFLYLLIRENTWCWPFGIASSLLSIYLFIDAKLYSEAILFLYYVAIGVYGWWVWMRPRLGGAPLSVIKWSWKKSLLAFVISLFGAIGLGYFFSSQTDAANPYVDATTTAFSFLASYLEAHKVLSAWLYWIAINAVSVWLYYQRDLEIYSALMLIYFCVSIYGYYTWKKRFNLSRP